MRGLVLVFTLLCSLFLGPVEAILADGIIIPIPDAHVRPLSLRSLAIKYHRVTVDIENQVATTHVDQVFLNETGYDLEGQYIFPVPHGAAISHFAMWVDGSKLEAQILDKDEARSIYEEIVRERRDPALLEYVGRSAFRASIYPIPAHGEKRVEIEYSEVLPLDHDMIRYVYPLNTEKFSSRPLQDVSISVRVSSRRTIGGLYSPSHELQIDRVSDYQADLKYHDANVTPDKDFELLFSVGSDDLGINVISYREADDDGFFLMLVSPPRLASQRQAIPKDVLLVLDTSGSMRGAKLAQAKRAAKYVLENLNREDRFGIVAFSSGAHIYAKQLSDIHHAESALSFIDDLTAGGGTNIDLAFQEALRHARLSRPQVVLFLTDGLATEGETRTDKILARVADLASDSVRLFTFGVGYDVNTILLDTLAEVHHGSSLYVRPGEDIERGVSSLYDRISSPVLSSPTLDLGSIRGWDLYPNPLPDLFAGSQLVLLGRYREAATTELVLSGYVNGRLQTHEYADVRFRTAGGANFIPRLWATRKIGHLLTQISLHGSNRELVDEIVALSVRYGIVTPYTSFLVDEEEDALSSRGREQAAQRMADAQELGSGGARAPSAESGVQAVEKSIAQNALREQAVEPPQHELVRTIGSKAFVRRGEIWTDTIYDPQKFEPVKIAFGGGSYMQLLSTHPEWAPILALGDRVLLVWEGIAYQIEPGITETYSGPAPSRTPGPPHATPTPLAQPTARLPLWKIIGGWFGLD